jgi:gliding motility-associated-like protein
MKRLLQFFFLIVVIFPTHGQEIDHDHSLMHAFVENAGQWPEPVLFKTKFHGGNMWVQQRKFLFHLQDFSRLQELHARPKDSEEIIYYNQSLVHVNFPTANEVRQVEKSGKTKAYYNFFIGNDPSKWASEVYGYSEAILREFYNGIDLKLIEKKEELKYEFHVQPGADPTQVFFNYGGVSSLRLNEKGDLIVQTDLGQIIEKKPYCYQVINGKIKEINSSYVLEGMTVRFKLGAYDPKAILVIDPILVFATYSGSVTDNFGMTATYGYDATAYSGGIIYGNQYPTPDPLAWDVTSNITVASTNVATTDAFISKYSANGTTMLWTTFIGGGDNVQGTETAHSLICDQNNNVYLYGVTSALDFPVQGGFQTAHAGGSTLSVNFNGTNFGNVGTDIFVAKFSANGQNLLGSTYIGGSGNDGVNYKVTSGVYNSVAAYDSLSINYGDQFRGEIMLDQDGNCIVASCTRSTNFPVLDAFQSTNAGMQDGVIFKMTPNLDNLIWSSYFGGENNDACYSVKVDSSYNVVFVGGTSSTNLPFTSGGLQPNYNGGKTDGFAVKLLPNGNTVVNATYLGTSELDQAFFVEIDRNDNVFVLGQSLGGLFPVNNAPYNNPGSSQFIIKLSPDLTTNLNSTVFGNGSPLINISPAAFLVDICGNMYVSGWGANILQGTPLSGMPVTSDAFQATAPNGFDFYLIVIKREFTDILYGTYLGGATAQEHVDGGTSRFDKNGVVYQSACGGCGGHSDFPTTPGAWSSQNLSSNCNNLVFKFDFELIPKAEFTVDDNLGCASFEVTFDNFSTDSDSYLWDFGNGDTTSVIFNPTMLYTEPGTYDIYLYVTDSICLLTDTAMLTITVLDSIQLLAPASLELCSPTELILTANSFGTASYFIWSSSLDFLDTLNASVLDSVLTITPTGTTTYYIEAGNAACKSIDSVTVEFISSALVLSGDSSICLNENTLITATNLNPSITFDYQWSPASVIIGPSNGNQVQVSPPTTQYLYVTASASNGCLIQDSILIQVSTIPDGSVVASATEYTIPQGGTTTLIGAPDGYSYSWIPNSSLVSPTSQQTEAQVYENTVFILSVTDGICTRYDTVQIKVYTFICDEPFVYVPNAFTPNGDGENDVLFVRGPLIEGLVFRVFDRWGEMVFESFDRLEGWDGTFRGKALDPDVYDFYLKALCVDGTEGIIKGNVTLMR